MDPFASASSLADAAGTASTRAESTPAAPVPAAVSAPVRLEVPADGATLPSAAALAAEGVALPSLRLELHAFSGRPHERFVFINGRKYVEGDRLAEGPQVVSIAPTGAVLAHAGRQFMLVQD
jgi:general secretion pathway protein B